MMQVDRQTYRDEFARVARRHREDALARDKDRDRRKEQQATDRDEDVGTDTIIMVLATQDQIVAFNDRLDGYEANVLEDLIELEHRLAEIRTQKALMLEQAYVLPDGRRVFKFSDGERAIDDYGDEVGPAEVDRDILSDNGITGERFAAMLEAETRTFETIAAGEALLDKKRGMQERAAESGVSSDDLDAMMEDFEASLADFNADVTSPGQPIPDATVSVRAPQPLTVPLQP